MMSKKEDLFERFLVQGVGPVADYYYSYRYRTTYVHAGTRTRRRPVRACHAAARDRPADPL